MKIYLIRHGESTGDIEDRYGGDYDDHLSEKGQSQATELAVKLKDKGIEKVFVSPLIRAKETDETVRSILEIESEIVENLRERNQYGILTGMVKSEAKEKYPELVEELKNFHNTIKNAESYENFQQRIIAAFENIVMQKSSCVAVITHGGPIKVILRKILNTEKINDINDCGFCIIESENTNYKLLDTEQLYK